MKQIIDVKNYKVIINSLFDKFKSNHNTSAIETIIAIQLDFRNAISDDKEACTQFDKFVCLYVWIPLLDLYSNQPKKLGVKHKLILDKLLKTIKILAMRKDEISTLILDWCIKSVNFQFENQKILNTQIYSSYLEIMVECE